ncbi:MAG: hypothetical protein JW914_02065 [Syntrophaceae bacterium]|nr:hypothetical protein [Syntrophaceae bacterium]
MTQTPYKLHRHIKKSAALISAILVTLMLSVSLFVIFEPEMKMSYRVAGLLMTVFWLYLTISFVKNLRLFTYIILDNKKIIVPLRNGSDEEYPVPETIKKLEFNYGHLWIDFDNGRRKVRLSEYMFKEHQVFKQWISANVPVVRCYKDGRVEQASFFDGNTSKNSVIVIGTPDTVIVTPKIGKS